MELTEARETTAGGAYSLRAATTALESCEQRLIWAAFHLLLCPSCALGPLRHRCLGWGRLSTSGAAGLSEGGQASCPSSPQYLITYSLSPCALFLILHPSSPRPSFPVPIPGPLVTCSHTLPLLPFEWCVNDPAFNLTYRKIEPGQDARSSHPASDLGFFMKKMIPE